MGVRVRGQGGQLPPPNSGKTVGKIRAKQEECVKFRANQPLCLLNQRVAIRPCLYQVVHVSMVPWTYGVLAHFTFRRLSTGGTLLALRPQNLPGNDTPKHCFRYKSNYKFPLGGLPSCKANKELGFLEASTAFLSRQPTVPREVSSCRAVLQLQRFHQGSHPSPEKSVLVELSCSFSVSRPKRC